jgi:predicted methyltransferase
VGQGGEPGAVERGQQDSHRDADRLPLVMLGFSGIKPGDKVAELVPAQGYATRLLSAAVGPNGRVYAINIAALNQQIKDQTKPVLADPNYKNVSYSEQTLSELKTPEPVDLVWTSQNYHDVHNVKDIDVGAFNKTVFESLKPGGIYIVIDHAAEKGSGFSTTSTLHRSEPDAVKAEVMAAGFEFVGSSDVIANPADDHKAKVFEQGLRDKTDRYVLKFRKPK